MSRSKLTCIAGVEGKDGVVLGGDSAGAGKYSIEIRSEEKVFSVGAFIFGFSDSFRMGQLLRYSLSIPRLPELDADFERWMATEFIDSVRQCLDDGGFASKKNGVEEGGQFLVGAAGRLYCVDTDYQVGRTSCGYNAIGAGNEYALGVLHATRAQKSPRKRVFAALEASATHSAFVAPPFTIIEQKV